MFWSRKGCQSVGQGVHCRGLAGITSVPKEVFPAATRVCLESLFASCSAASQGLPSPSWLAFDLLPQGKAGLWGRDALSAACPSRLGRGTHTHASQGAWGLGAGFQARAERPLTVSTVLSSRLPASNFLLAERCGPGLFLHLSLGVLRLACKSGMKS